MSKPQNVNDNIIEAIQRIARKALVDPKTGVIKGPKRISGYVKSINTTGEWAGTIDVQEYITNPTSETDGFHPHVFISAIQDNNNGVFMIPVLYSEVVITQDPGSNLEYVIMYSRVDTIQFKSHEKITVGVSEFDSYDIDNPDAPDIEDLEETGVLSKTEYTKNQVKTSVISQNNESNLTVSDSEIKSTFNNRSVTINENGVWLGDTSNTEPAVLGNQLASILEEFLGLLSQTQTTTQLGPQPFLNVAQYASLKAKITSFKNSTSGFLTKVVKIQK